MTNHVSQTRSTYKQVQFNMEGKQQESDDGSLTKQFIKYMNENYPEQSRNFLDDSQVWENGQKQKKVYEDYLIITKEQLSPYQQTLISNKKIQIGKDVISSLLSLIDSIDKSYARKEGITKEFIFEQLKNLITPSGKGYKDYKKHFVDNNTVCDTFISIYDDFNTNDQQVKEFKKLIKDEIKPLNNKRLKNLKKHLSPSGKKTKMSTDLNGFISLSDFFKENMQLFNSHPDHEKSWLEICQDYFYQALANVINKYKEGVEQHMADHQKILKYQLFLLMPYDFSDGAIAASQHLNNNDFIESIDKLKSTIIDQLNAPDFIDALDDMLPEEVNFKIIKEDVLKEYGIEVAYFENNQDVSLQYDNLSKAGIRAIVVDTKKHLCNSFKTSIDIAPEHITQQIDRLRDIMLDNENPKTLEQIKADLSSDQLSGIAINEVCQTLNKDDQHSLLNDLTDDFKEQINSSLAPNVFQQTVKLKAVDDCIEQYFLNSAPNSTDGAKRYFEYYNKLQKEFLIKPAKGFNKRIPNTLRRNDIITLLYLNKSVFSEHIDKLTEKMNDLALDNSPHEVDNVVEDWLEIIFKDLMPGIEQLNAPINFVTYVGEIKNNFNIDLTVLDEQPNDDEMASCRERQPTPPHDHSVSKIPILDFSKSNAQNDVTQLPKPTRPAKTFYSESSSHPRYSNGSCSRERTINEEDEISHKGIPVVSP